MEAQASSYVYTPLDEYKRQIRLLHLHPVPTDRQSSKNATDLERADIPDSGDEDDWEDVFDNEIDYDEEIHCTFSIVSLDDKPDYEALSYVWGDAKNRDSVTLHGHTFPITRKLFDALFHMRQSDERVLWADALCIDQDNSEERASQVAQMGHIFTSASTVTVFLGTWAQAADAFALVKIIGGNPWQHHYKELQQGLE